MKLLEAHGITLLPEDNGGSSNMIHSGGRATLALSEAGKMMLSSSTSQHLSNKGTTIVTTVALVESWCKGFFTASFYL